MTLLPAPHALRHAACATAAAAAACCLAGAATTAWAAGTGAPARPDAAAKAAAARPPASATEDAAQQQLAVALGDLGLALLRDSPGANAVVSPLAVATVLGMVQSGATGNTEHEIEALFGPGRAGAMAMRRSLPALSAQLREATGGNARPVAAARAGGGAGAAHSAHSAHAVRATGGGNAASASSAKAPAQAAASAAGGPAVRQAARVWIDSSVAKDTPASFKHRLAVRHGADALVLSFADTEAARAQINRWTAEHTAGRIAELLPAGSLAKSTQLTLTAAVHFRSAWAKPFDAAQTEPRPFAGIVPVNAASAASAASGAAGAPTVPTLRDERPLAQAVVDGHRLYALPFAAGYDLVLGLPAEAGSGAGGAGGSGLDAMLKSLDGAALARWRAALKSAEPARCSFSMPKFAFAPKAGSIKASLQRLGVQTAFTDKAELKPMLGRAAPGAHVDDVHHAAGIAVDENGGEAVAAAAATVKPKSLALPAPPCAVDRAFAFVVMHRASGAPLFVGRVSDPARSE